MIDDDIEHEVHPALVHLGAEVLEDVARPVPGTVSALRARMKRGVLTRGSHHRTQCR